MGAAGGVRDAARTAVAGLVKLAATASRVAARALTGAADLVDPPAGGRKETGDGRR